MPGDTSWRGMHPRRAEALVVVPLAEPEIVAARHVSRQQRGALGIAKIDRVRERHQRLSGGLVGGVEELGHSAAVPRLGGTAGQLPELVDRSGDAVPRIWRRFDREA